MKSSEKAQLVQPKRLFQQCHAELQARCRFRANRAPLGQNWSGWFFLVDWERLWERSLSCSIDQKFSIHFFSLPRVSKKYLQTTVDTNWHLRGKLTFLLVNARALILNPSGCCVHKVRADVSRLAFLFCVTHTDPWLGPVEAGYCRSYSNYLCVLWLS